MNYKKIFLFCFLLLAINFVAASYELGNQSHVLSPTYGSNSSLIGFLNISFDTQPINSLFTDSEGNSVELEELLNTTSNELFYEYSCDVLDCGSSYESVGKETIKVYSLSAGEEIIIGLEFEGNIERITNIEYTVQSNALAACASQFKIDFLDDNSSDYTNTNALSISCDNKNTGCYNISEGGEETIITSTPFCQKIKIPETPKVELGVWLKENTPGTRAIHMALYDLEGNEIDNCEISKGIMTSTGSEVSCVIDYPAIESEDYYVCTYSTGVTGDFRTKGYIGEDNCGFHGVPVKNASASYYLFVNGQKYAAPGEVVVSDQLGIGKAASLLAEEYIVEKYGSMNCESSCYVPIKITSNVAQTITLKDFTINSDKVSFPGTSSNEFHLLNETPAKINSEIQTLSLGGLFVLPEEFGKFDYTLSLEGDQLFEEELEIKNASITLTPTIAAAGFPITFEATFHSDLNETSYLWDFGTEGMFETFSNKKTIVFDEEGNYSLNLMIETENALFSKEFLIYVSSPEETINQILAELKYKKENLEKQILNLDYNLRDKIKEDLEWESVSTLILLLEEKYNAAKISGNYSDVIPYISETSLPDAIIQASVGKLSYFPEISEIDVEIVAKTFGDFYSQENYEAYQDAILFYNMDDYQIKISMKEVNYNLDGEIVTFLRSFYLDVSGKAGDYTHKIFIEAIPGIELSENISESNGYWVLSPEEANSLVIFTGSNLEITDLPIFLAPSLSSLNIIDGPIEDYKFPWWILIVSLVGLIILGGIVYFVLHRWYDKKYEKSLFSNRNNLFNLITYINNQKAKGSNESEIRSKLHKAKWSSEQIRYVLRKYLGKNTGMWKPEKTVKKVKRIGPKVMNKSQPRVGDKKIKGVKQVQRALPVGGIKYRKIGLVILFSIITFGIYTIYWLISTSNELRKFDKRAPSAGLIIAPWIIIFLTILSGFFISRNVLQGDTSNLFLIIYGLVILIASVLSIIVYLKYSKAHNKVTKFSQVGLFILLMFFGPIGVIVSQVQLNKVATARQKT